jgi:hypothetical protein
MQPMDKTTCCCPSSSKALRYARRLVLSMHVFHSGRCWGSSLMFRFS